MVGLGPGARSYTSTLHYSTEWAVGRHGVRQIIDRWVDERDDEHARAGHGIELDGEEQRRRFVIQSVLQSDGLDAGAYGARFGTDPFDDLPQLSELTELELAEVHGQPGVPRRLVLTPAGMERSDVIGPWLVSDRVAARMRAFELR
jgi:oxygen-independent coproporphyrinogen-3 oxidase